MADTRFWSPARLGKFKWIPKWEWNHCNTDMLAVYWLHRVWLWRWDNREKAAW